MIRIFLILFLLSAFTNSGNSQELNDLQLGSPNKGFRKWTNTVLLTFDLTKSNSRETKFFKKKFKDILILSNKIGKNKYSIPLNKLMEFKKISLCDNNTKYLIELNVNYYYKKGKYDYDDLMNLTEFILNCTIDSVWARDKILDKLSHLLDTGEGKIEIVTKSYPLSYVNYWVDQSKNFEANRNKSKKSVYNYQFDRSSWDSKFYEDSLFINKLLKINTKVYLLTSYNSGIPFHVTFKSSLPINEEIRENYKLKVLVLLRDILKNEIRDTSKIFRDLEDYSITLKYLKGFITRNEKFWESIFIRIKDIKKLEGQYQISLGFDGTFYGASTSKCPSDETFKEDSNDMFPTYKENVKEWLATLKNKLEYNIRTNGIK